MNDELDILKNEWNKIADLESRKGYSEEQLRKIVKKNSNGELAKIRRKFQLEWGLSLLLSVFAVLFVYAVNPNDTIFAIVFLGVIFVVGFIPYISLFSLNQSTHPDLKNYLKEYVARFEKLVKQYTRMAAVLIPVVSIGGFLLGFHSAVSAEEWAAFFITSNIVIFAGGGILLSCGGCWFQSRYFKWVYGKNIQRLNDNLAELEQVEE